MCSLCHQKLAGLSKLSIALIANLKLKPPARACLEFGHIRRMTRDRPQDFTCPRCQARYKTVGMQSEPGTVYRMLQCTVCQQELAPTEGDDILKYFLVSRPRPENRTSRTRGSQLKRS